MMNTTPDAPADFIMPEDNTPLTEDTPTTIPILDTLSFIGFTPRNESEMFMFANCSRLNWFTGTDMTLGTLYLALSIMGISENLYVFYEIYLSSKFRINQSRASFFLLVGNLAVGDILILTLPVWVSIHGLFNNRDILHSNSNHLFNATVVFIHSCCARVSIIFVMFIAAFRVISVTSPLNISRVFSILRTVVISSLSWLLVIILTVYSYDGTIRNAVYSKTAGMCMVVLRNKTHESLSVAGQILLPFLVPGVTTFLALIYLIIFMFKMYNSKLSKYRDNSSTYRPARERESLKMTLKLIVCFVLFYTPWYVDGMLEFMKNSKTRNIAYRIHRYLTRSNCFSSLFWHHLCLGGLLFISAATNPFLYGQTLIHVSQQNTHRGLVQILVTRVVTVYRKIKHEKMSKRDDEATPSLLAQSGIVPGIKTTPLAPKNNVDDDSYEMSKLTLLSDIQDSTVQSPQTINLSN